MAASSPESFESFDMDFFSRLSSPDPDHLEIVTYEFGVNGERQLNDEEIKLYCDALKEHQGFGDFPDLPDSPGFGMIGPVDNLKDPGYEKLFLELTGEAIEEYNKENGTNFEVVEVTKANCRSDCGILYFLTFEVKPIGSPTDHPTATFQAKVLSGINEEIVVDLCRPKPTN